MVVSRHPHLRAYASCVAVGLAGMIFASCMLAELARFDPVYRSVFYLSGRPKINKLVAGSLLSKVLVSAIPGGSLVAGPANFLVEQISGGLISIDSDDAGSLPSVDLTIPVRVWNPNPYRVTIKPMRPGSGYFINPDIKIATVNLAAATFDEGIGEDGCVRWGASSGKVVLRGDDRRRGSAGSGLTELPLHASRSSQVSPMLREAGWTPQFPKSSLPVPVRPARGGWDRWTGSRGSPKERSL